MHDDGVRAHQPHDRGVDAGRAASAAELGGVLEALLLDARLVHDVGVGGDISEARAHRVADATAGEQGEDVTSHLDHLGRDEAQVDAGIVRQQQGQRPGGAAIPEVTAEHDVEPLDAPQLVLDGVEVEQRLGGMLAGTVAGVDDRHRADRGGAGRRAGLVVAEHDDVGVGGRHANGVLEGLPLDDAGELPGGLGPDHRAPQAEHRGLEGEPRPRARLVEEGGHDPAGQPLVPGAVERPCVLEDPAEQRLIELVAAEDVIEEARLRRGHHHHMYLRAPAALRAGGAPRRHAAGAYPAP